MPAKKRGARACRHAQGHTGTAAFKKRKQRNLFDRQNFHFLFCHQSNWPKTSFTRDKKKCVKLLEDPCELFLICYTFQLLTDLKNWRKEARPLLTVTTQTTGSNKNWI